MSSQTGSYLSILQVMGENAGVICSNPGSCHDRVTGDVSPGRLLRDPRAAPGGPSNWSILVNGSREQSCVTACGSQARHNNNPQRHHVISSSPTHHLTRDGGAGVAAHNSGARQPPDKVNNLLHSCHSQQQSLPVGLGEPVWKERRIIQSHRRCGTSLCS